VKYSSISSRVYEMLNGPPLTQKQLDAMEAEVRGATERLRLAMNEGPELSGIERVRWENKILRAWVPVGRRKRTEPRTIVGALAP